MSVSLGRATSGFVADTISFSNVDGPGNRFVVFMQGCNFDCLACHNPQTIPGNGMVEGHHPRHMTVADLLPSIRRAAPFIRGITVTGGEATQQAAFVHELLAAVRDDPGLARLSTLVDSNGACPLEVWDTLAPVMDGAMIDLKCLDSDIHVQMTGQPNRQVLDSIRHLASIERLYEVRLLLVAGANDGDDLLRRTAEWLAAIDAQMRVKVIGFRAHGVRPYDPPLLEPSPEALAHAADVLGDVALFDLTVL